MTYNDILSAIAAAIVNKWSQKHVFVNEIPKDADGNFFVRIIEAEQTSQGHRVRHNIMIEVIYYLEDPDTLEYNAWLDTMFTALNPITVGEFVLIPLRTTARQDSDSRYYQFAFSLDFSLYTYSVKDKMTEIETNISED